MALPPKKPGIEGAGHRLRTFASAREFRAWLRAHHRSAAELLLWCYKVAAKDQGLTPRKARSTWSAINIQRAQELEAEGRMQPAGRAAFAARQTLNSRRYSFESKPRKLAPIYRKKLRANERAWSFFRVQAPWYRRTSIFWVMEAKREETRLRRLSELIERSARGEPIRPLAGKPLRTAGSHER